MIGRGAEPAFPCGEPDPEGECYSGISRREWFAGMALAGLVAAKVAPSTDTFRIALTDEITQGAFHLADAMIARLDGGGHE